MGRPKGNSGNAREKLLEAAGRGFRAGGYGGIGVDGLAKEAGLTSGAFYAHFGSKADAFRLAMLSGLEFLKGGIETFQGQYGQDWLTHFIDFYLGERLELDLSEACALPSLSPDVARADNETRDAYTAELKAIAAVIAERLPGANREERAWQLLSILSGAATMVRAASDPVVTARIVTSVKVLAKGI